MNIITNRCKIRNFTTDDAAELYEVLSDSEVMKYIEAPFTLEQTEEFIEDTGLIENPLVYALEFRGSGEISSKVIGHVIFHPYDEESYEIGWIINRKYWGMGIASEVTEALITYVRENNIKECVIECDPEQEATKAIAIKFGFAYEGIEDDCCVYRWKSDEMVIGRNPFVK